MNTSMKIVSFFLIILFLIPAHANSIGNETGLELPRFISLKSNESNLRVGPSKNYPITIKYIKNNFPLKIIEEYKDWRKVIDFQDNTGWIHKSLIKGERNGIIISPNKKKVNIYNTVSGVIVGDVTNGSLVQITKCKLYWCQIKKNNYKGWVEKKFIWGVKQAEKFNIGIIQILNDYLILSINFINKNIFK